jgi:UDP:flavonoid glycosyltransferase YjiC (YdhE family)
MGRVLVSPLNWGLGHATRDIPVIRKLLSHGHEVTIAAHGNALAALEQEFSDCATIDFPDYAIPASADRFFLAKFLLSLPSLLHGIAQEREELLSILAKDRYDLIISDNRLGVFSDRIPSLFITHQLHYHLPPLAWPCELSGIWLNSYLHERFSRVIVPDNPPGQLALAGKLSRAETDITRERAYYAGILTGMKRRDVVQDLDYLFVISGPEPQRTTLERSLLAAAQDLTGSVAVLLGSPNGKRTVVSGNQTVMSYASTEEKELLMNRAACIVCRSGYTTMMELAELKKRHALLVPTPGQTEQEYLAGYYQQKGWFAVQEQHRLDVETGLRAAAAHTGFPEVPGTEENVDRLYRDVLAGYLE